MAALLPAATRGIRLVTVPEGLPGPEHFAVVERPPTAPGPGQVLVQGRYFLVFPGLRTLLGAEPGAAPLPPIRPAAVLFGPAVGEVVAAGAGSPLRPGDTVTHLLGWREHALVAAAHCTPVGHVLPDRSPTCRPGRPPTVRSRACRHPPRRHGPRHRGGRRGGDTGRPGRQVLGAGRVVSTTRSPAKADRLRTELGYDAVVVPDGGFPTSSGGGARRHPMASTSWWTPWAASN